MHGWMEGLRVADGRTDRRTEGVILDIEVDTLKLPLALVDFDFTKSLI